MRILLCNCFKDDFVAKSKAKNVKKSKAAKAKAGAKPKVMARRTPVHKSIHPKANAAVVKKVAGKLKINVRTGEEAKSTPIEKRPRRKEVVANIYTPEEVNAALQQLSEDEAVVGYLKKNVSKRALDVLNALTTPKTDDALAAELDMKINAVRRILNLMQGAGITNYYIAKNVNGWLSFAWYINMSKIPPFFDYVNSVEMSRPMVNSECNDYFVCKNCYEATKLLFTFDAAFEEDFKCNSCGKNLAAMNRDEATTLISTVPKVEA